MFTSHADYRRRVAFQIMLHLGVTDCVLLLGLTYEGFVWTSDIHFSPTTEKIFGALMRGGSDCNFCIQLVLAINRYLVFRPSSSKSCENMYTRLIGVCWICFFLPLASYLTPYCSTNLANRARAWRNEVRCDTSFVAWVRASEKIGKAATCVCTFLLYAATIWIMFYKRRRFSITGSKRMIRSRGEELERHILIYALCVFVAGFTSLMTGYFGQTDALLVTSDITWQFSCVVRSAFLLILNRELKKRFINFLLRHNGKKSSVCDATAMVCPVTVPAQSPVPPLYVVQQHKWSNRAATPNFDANNFHLHNSTLQIST